MPASSASGSAYIPYWEMGEVSQDDRKKRTSLSFVNVSSQTLHVTVKLTRATGETVYDIGGFILPGGTWADYDEARADSPPDPDKTFSFDLLPGHKKGVTIDEDWTGKRGWTGFGVVSWSTSGGAEVDGGALIGHVWTERINHNHGISQARYNLNGGKPF